MFVATSEEVHAMKVNVAQYVMNDLTNRFPMQNEDVVDREVIDFLVEGWSKRKYVTPNAAALQNHRPLRIRQPYLM
jgi:hypothetical protein